MFSNKRNIIMAGVLVLVVIIVVVMAITGAFSTEPSAPISSSSYIEVDSSVPVSSSTPNTQDAGISEIGEPQQAVDFFRLEDSRIKLPATLTYPEATDQPNTTTMLLGNQLNIGLSKNWVANLDGNRINAIHTSGPSTTISMAHVIKVLDKEVINQQLQSFLTECGVETATVSDIFMNNNVVGRIASANITMNEEAYLMDIAIWECDRFVFYMVTIYPPETEETVIALYNTFSSRERRVKIK